MRQAGAYLRMIAAISAAILAAGGMRPAEAQSTPAISLEHQTSFGLNGANPWGIASDRGGNLYVAEGLSGTVVKFPAGCASTSCETVLPFSSPIIPTGVAVDSQGNVYTVDYNGGAVLELPAGCNSSSCQVTVVSGLKKPVGGLAVDTVGNVYVADSGNNQVVKYPYDCCRIDQQTTVGVNLDSPAGVAVDGNYTVYITEAVAGASPPASNLVIVPELCFQSSCQTTVPLGNVSADHVTLDGMGNVFVGVNSPAEVLEIPVGCSTSSCILKIPASGLGGPSDVAFDGTGNLYIADYTGAQIVERAMTSMNVGTASVGGYIYYTLTYRVGASPDFSPYARVLTLGNYPADFGWANQTCSGTIANNTTCTVSIAFTPQGPGVRSGVVEVLDSAQHVLITTNVSGIGMGPGAVIDQAAPTVLSNALKYPAGVALDGYGDIFIADSGNNRVVEIPTGCTSSSCQMTAVSGVTGATGMAVDGMGNLYTSYGNGGATNTLMRFPPNCSSLSCGTALGQILPESQFFMDRNGNLFINASPRNCFQRKSGCVLEVPWGCTSSACFVSLGIQISDPVGVAADGQGNVYALDEFTETIYKVAANGSQSTYVDQLGAAGTLTMDSPGNLYFTDGNYGDITEIPLGCASPTCYISTTIPTNVPGSPLYGLQLSIDSLAVDPSGNLVAVDFSYGLAISLPRAKGGSLSFAPLQVFQPLDPAQTFTLHNFGNQTLALNSFNVTPSSFTATGCSTTSLAAGASCTATINFDPQALGTINGTATFSDNALNGNSTQTVSLTGVGQPGQIYAGVVTNISGPSFTVDGVLYATNQNLSWTMGTTHTLSVTTPQVSTTTPGAEYVFTGWSDGTTTTTDTVTAPLTNTTYTANFNLAYQLTTAASPSAGGSVSPASGAYYTANTVVNLTATPSPGYAFNGWSGPVANPNAASTTVTMSAAASVTANFVQVVQVTVGTSPAGASFTVDGTTYSGAQTLSWTVGTKHTIATTSPQTPSTGTQYTFASWSDSGAISHQVTAAAGTTSYTANFDTTYQLTTSASPSAGGTVSPATQYFAPNTVVNLTATANTGYAFANWTGSVANSNSASTTVTMTGPLTVTANFVATVQVTIGTTPAGLSFSIDGTTYTTAQTVTWTVGSQHTIATTSPQTPSAGTQDTFASWSDSGAMSHQVTAAAGVTSYTASFNTTYQLTTSASPSAGGTVSPATQYYAPNTVVNLTATANAGYTFSGWTGSVANANNASTTVTMSGPQTVSASFTPTVQVTVGTTPAGLSFSIDGTNYTSTQTVTWTIGSQHTIATTSPQTPGAGTQDAFASWSDSGAMSHQVTATAGVTSYTAAFNTTYQLTTSASPGAGGTVSPASGQYYAPNTVVNLTATPNTGYVFTGWTGSVANANNASTTVTMSGPQTVSATFTPTVQVTVGTIPAGLSFSIDGTSYTSAQTVTWTVGAQHTIATTSPQTPGAGTQDTFASWSDSGAMSHVVTAAAGVTSYTAGFNTTYQLTTSASPTAGGTVSPASGGYYAPGAVVNLTATPAVGYVFGGWTGSVANANSASTTVTMNGPVSVSANFTPTVQVTVGTNPAGLAFSVDGTAYSSAQRLTWVIGSQHSVSTTGTQAPAAGTQDTFAAWSDGGALSHTVTASAAVTAYTAGFNTSYQLTTAASPAAGGSVTPASGGYYAAGSQAALTATPAAGYIFSGWTGPAANPASASTTVTMSGPASVTAGFISAIRVTPPSIAIGTVYQGTATTEQVTVSNLGIAAIAINGASITAITGGNASEYSLSNGCPKSLAGGGSCTITITFTAGAYYTPQTAALRIADGAPDSPQAAALSATVIDPVATLEFSKLSFSSTAVNTSNTNTMTLKNTGGTALSITGMTMTGPDASDFKATSNCGSSLAAGASCTVTITFTPTTSGSLSATLTIADNAQSGTQSVALSGKAH